jgi:glycosyltransferase involved in cell wall biosynthesis
MPELPLTFSVITCCYNQGAFIEQNIRSVLDQHYPGIEHIVINSGTDETEAICKRYPHVQYHFQEPAGQCAALNLGFSNATGDIIAWLNSDDTYEPDTFKCIAEAMTHANTKTLIGGEAAVVNAEGEFMWKLKNGRIPFYRLLALPMLYRRKGRTRIPCQPAVFFRRSLIADIGDLRTDLKFGMDYEFWLRALTRGYRFQHIRQAFANYRYHDASLTVEQGYDIFLKDWTSVSEAYRAALPPAHRCAAHLWDAFFIAESALFRRHTFAEARLARIRNAAPGSLALSKRVTTYLIALLNAPWLLPGMVRRTLIPRKGEQ